MNDKQDKQPLLVEQNEALGVYFDSLLSAEDMDYLDDIQPTEAPSEVVGQTTANNENAAPEPKNTVETDEQRLKSAREFLQASKLRQQKLGTPKQPSNETAVENKPLSEPTKAKVNVKAKSTPTTVAGKIITSGPQSPKPREAIQSVPEESVKTVERPSQIAPESVAAVKPKAKPQWQAKFASQSAAAKPVIIFSEKDKDGQVKQEVLIPRSQRLAQNKSTAEDTTPAITKRIPGHNKSRTSSPMPANKTKDKLIEPIKPSTTEPSTIASPEATENDNSQRAQLAPRATTSNPVKEAPALDLSLFLPKIKTLSDEEIKQQLEALTQAAVSQAQVESDLQELSQYEKYKQQTQHGESESLIKNINNAPDWAIPEFQVLLFAVAGLKLAIPLSELNGILEWGEEYINELPGHASWYLGLINHLGQNVPVIDTLQQVVPRERWPAEHLKKPKFKHIILIDDGHWGLACEQVLEIITLKTESVKWRSSRTKRRWLLGTVIDHMCALLDSAEFASMLKTGKDSLVTTQ